MSDWFVEAWMMCAQGEEKKTNVTFDAIDSAFSDCDFNWFVSVYIKIFLHVAPAARIRMTSIIRLKHLFCRFGINITPFLFYANTMTLNILFWKKNSCFAFSWQTGTLFLSIIKISVFKHDCKIFNWFTLLIIRINPSI